MLTTLGALPIAASPAFRTSAGLVFGGFLCLASIYDVRTRRIPNWLVTGLAILGLTFSALTAPPPSHWTGGLWMGFKGLLMGLAIWFPSWMVRMLGAGDVKFFAAASAWLGARGAFVGSVLAAIAGGVLALLWMVRYRGLRGSLLTFWTALIHPKSLLQPVRADATTLHASYAPAIPYTIALAFGAAVVSWIHRLFV